MPTSPSVDESVNGRAAFLFAVRGSVATVRDSAASPDRLACRAAVSAADAGASANAWSKSARARTIGGRCNGPIRRTRLMNAADDRRAAAAAVAFGQEQPRADRTHRIVGGARRCDAGPNVASHRVDVADRQMHERRSAGRASEQRGIAVTRRFLCRVHAPATSRVRCRPSRPRPARRPPSAHDDQRPAPARVVGRAARARTAASAYRPFQNRHRPSASDADRPRGTSPIRRATASAVPTTLSASSSRARSIHA